MYMLLYSYIRRMFISLVKEEPHREQLKENTFHQHCTQSSCGFLVGGRPNTGSNTTQLKHIFSKSVVSDSFIAYGSVIYSSKSEKSRNLQSGNIYMYVVSYYTRFKIKLKLVEIEQKEKSQTEKSVRTWRRKHVSDLVST